MTQQFYPHKLLYFNSVNDDTKLITFRIEHLSEGVKMNLHLGKLNVYDISYQNIRVNYRIWATHDIENGYSVLFTHNDKTIILQYN